LVRSKFLPEPEYGSGKKETSGVDPGQVRYFKRPWSHCRYCSCCGTN